MNEDGTLKPNQEYTTGENGYTYKTDSNGNIVSAHADELKFKTHNGRLKHNPNTADKLQVMMRDTYLQTNLVALRNLIILYRKEAH